MSSVLSVSQLNKYISFKIKSDLKLKGLAVKGEISNFTIHYKSGHAYFTIKDTDASLKAVMFSSNVAKLKFMPENGMSVLVMGNLEVYERDGVYQIIASEIAPLGVGVINNKIEQLKEKLKKQGVFDTNAKKKIPLVPKKIAVVTSLTGAALQDILHICERRYPVCEIEIYPAQVQGAVAPQSICNALKSADNSGADTIILARGGGSVEDLMPFNTEIVALSVADCETPIISAVGHETDTTLCDYAADMRAATPSAAAEVVTPDRNDIINTIKFLKGKLDNSINSYISSYSVKADTLTSRLKLLSPEKKLNDNIKNLEEISSRLNKAVSKQLDNSSDKLDNLVAQLNLLSPFNILGRGYSLTEKDGELIDSTEKLSMNDLITVRFSDGTANAEITQINKF